jgi:two-component sensor histidine kinase
LTAVSTQAIGLALHELATNAGKYGALSTDTGRADISCGPEGDTFTMSWTERDGPPVSFREKIELTARLAKSRCEQQLEAGGYPVPHWRQNHSWKGACLLTPLSSRVLGCV